MLSLPFFHNRCDTANSSFHLEASRFLHRLPPSLLHLHGTDSLFFTSEYLLQVAEDHRLPPKLKSLSLEAYQHPSSSRRDDRSAEDMENIIAAFDKRGIHLGWEGDLEACRQGARRRSEASYMMGRRDAEGIVLR